MFTIFIFNISGFCFAKTTATNNDNNNNNNNKIEYNQIGTNKNESLVNVNTNLKAENNSNDDNFDMDKYDADSYNIRDIIIKKLNRLHEKGEFTNITESQINQLSSDDLKTIAKEFIKENNKEIDYDENSEQIDSSFPLNYDKSVLKLVKQKLINNKIPLAVGGAIGGGLILLSSKLNNKERIEALLAQETPYAKKIRELKTIGLDFDKDKPKSNQDILYMAMNDIEGVNKITKDNLISNINELKTDAETFNLSIKDENELKESIKNSKDSNDSKDSKDNDYYTDDESPEKIAENDDKLNEDKKTKEILKAFSETKKLENNCKKNLNDYLSEVTNMSFREIKKEINQKSNDLITKQYGSKLEDALDEEENKIHLNPNGVTKK